MQREHVYMCLWCYWRGLKRLNTVGAQWVLVSLLTHVFANLMYSFPYLMYYFAKLAYLGFIFFSLKVQSFQHSGISNFATPLQIYVPFSQMEVEPAFDKQFYAVSMLCCGSFNTETDLNAMVKCALPFLCQSLLLVVPTPKYSMILFLINKFLEIH